MKNLENYQRNYYIYDFNKIRIRILPSSGKRRGFLKLYLKQPSHISELDSEPRFDRWPINISYLTGLHELSQEYGFFSGQLYICTYFASISNKASTTGLQIRTKTLNISQSDE